MTQQRRDRLDGTTLIVRIPMRFQRRGGRKRIVAPDGSEIVPTTKPQPDGTLVKALARAWRWHRDLRQRRHCLTSSRGSSTSGRRQDPTEFLKPFPVAWKRQPIQFW